MFMDYKFFVDVSFHVIVWLFVSFLAVKFLGWITPEPLPELDRKVVLMAALLFLVLRCFVFVLRWLRIYSFADYVGFLREYWGNMFFPILYCLIFIVSVWFFMLLDNLLSPDFSAVEEVEEVESVGELFTSDY